MKPVSPGNPCPFLRAAVASDFLEGHRDPLSSVGQFVVDAGGSAGGKARVVRLVVSLIALIGNGLGPKTLWRNFQSGLVADELRGGPLDKRGAGSRILDATAQVDHAQLDRLDQFAVDCTDAHGVTERGLGSAQLVTMMDANFARAAGSRRGIDRPLMNGEWPVLLSVIGKDGPGGRYLSLADVRALYVDRTLPARILARMDARVTGRVRPAATHD